MSCPVCNASKNKVNPELTFIHAKTPCEVLKCSVCTVEFRNINQSTMSQLLTEDYYGDKDNNKVETSGYQADYSSAANNLRNNAKYYLGIINKLKPKNIPNNNFNILDIGCAFGYFLEVCKKEYNYQVFGNDFNNYAIERAKQILNQTDCLQAGDFSKTTFPKNFFHAVTTFEVLSHIINPTEFFNQLNNISSNNALLLITTPTTDSIFRKILKNKWWWYNSSYVIWHNKKSITYLLKKYGYKIISITPRRSAFTAEYLFDFVNNYYFKGKLSFITILLNKTGIGKLTIPLRRLTSCMCIIAQKET